MGNCIISVGGWRKQKHWKRRCSRYIIGMGGWCQGTLPRGANLGPTSSPLGKGSIKLLNMLVGVLTMPCYPFSFPVFLYIHISMSFPFTTDLSYISYHPIVCLNIPHISPLCYLLLVLQCLSLCSQFVMYIYLLVFWTQTLIFSLTCVLVLCAS